MKSSAKANDAMEPIRAILRDPIAQVLLKNSNLTRVQFETFIIDSLWQQLSEETGLSKPRYALRLSRGRISRGAFNRTLIQARNNVIRSIYALFLLGYVGLFDSPKLEPFIEAADQIRTFVENREGKAQAPSKQTVALLASSLRSTIEDLAARKSFLETL